VCLTRYRSLGHYSLLLYGGPAPFAIKAHRSRGAVRPDLEAVAVAGLLLNDLRRLSPDGSHFVSRHADARLWRYGGRFFLGRRLLRGFFHLFFFFLVIHLAPPHPLQLAGQVLLYSLAPFIPAP